MNRIIRTTFALLCSLTLAAQQDAAIRGFSTANAAAEREVEKKFKAVPQNDRLREYMKTMSEEPHHAGSPNSRKNAEYILAKFKEFGLDAHIEEFEALMPYPVERVVE